MYSTTDNCNKISNMSRKESEYTIERNRMREQLKRSLATETECGLRNTPLIALSNVSEINTYSGDFCRDYLVQIAGGTLMHDAVLCQFYKEIKAQTLGSVEQMVKEISRLSRKGEKQIMADIVQQARKEQAGLKFGGYVIAVDMHKFCSSIKATKKCTMQEVEKTLRDMERKKVVTLYGNKYERTLIEDTFIKLLKCYKSADGKTYNAIYYLSPVFRAIVFRKDLSINGY